MVAEPVPETVAADPPAPGYCSIHPNEQLVTAKVAGLRTYWYGYGPAPAVVCPAASHNDADRERCRWCGGPLFPELVAGTRAHWQLSSRRLFCSPNHRLKAFRSAGH